jgi:hypothetical protein
MEYLLVDMMIILKLMFEEFYVGGHRLDASGS